MICSLDLLYAALSSSVTQAIRILKAVGTSQSIASFELEMTTWVTAYSAYSDIENYHNARDSESIDGLDILRRLNLHRTDESGILIVQKSEVLSFEKTKK